MSIFFLGIGSNQGDRLANLQSAIKMLSNHGTIIKNSSIYETEPKYHCEQPKFLNMACEINSDLSPIALFHCVKNIESELGRVTTFQNGPRVIDIDLLYSPEHTHSDSLLELPHPRLSERAFVLIPLAELTQSLILNKNLYRIDDLICSLDQNLISEVQLIKH